jgi:hypothetical protein
MLWSTIFLCWQHYVFYFHTCQYTLPFIIILYQRNTYIVYYFAMYILSNSFECFCTVIFTSQCCKNISSEV